MKEKGAKMENSRFKFRAWDKSEEEMIDNEAIFGNELCVQSGYQDEDFIFMQYTGLKDKNGVEIYEGDIVKTTSNELTGKWKHKIYKIEFKEINCVAGAKYMGFDFQFNVDEIEVIGNIYENSNLLGDNIEQN